MKNKKNSNYKGAKVASNKKNAKASQNKKLVVALCAFVGVVLVLGIILGSVALSRSAGSVVSYEGVYFDKGVTSYLIAYYKTEYLTKLIRQGVNAYDDEEFWKSSYRGVTKYADDFRDECIEYLRTLAAGNYVFDRYTTLTKKDKAKLENSINEVLDYKADGSKARFNELAEPMGFNFRDFKVATEIIYKAMAAFKVLYGENGANLSAGADPQGCDDYFANYSHVKLLFIRTNDDFVIDEDGNRVKDDEGNDELRELTQDEKDERAYDMELIDAAIAAIEENGDGQMSPEYFDSFYDKYRYDTDARIVGGYYFSAYSEFSEEFSNQFYDVVSVSLGMGIGEYAKVECNFGYCYIYKLENGEWDYAKSTYSEFFTDFYSDASEALYGTTLATISKDVKVHDTLRGIVPYTIPYNEDLVAYYS